MHIGLLVVLFVSLLLAVAAGWTGAIDRHISLAFRNPADGAIVGPRWFQEAARDVTSLGSLSVLGMALLIWTSELLAYALPRSALLLAGGVLSGTALCFGLKIPVARARPAIVNDAPSVFTASFPSAHAMTSITLAILAALLVARLTARPAVRMSTTVAAVALVLLIGASRLYLGVHWATDILAGWLAGAAWALVVWQFGVRFCRDEWMRSTG